MSFLRRGEPRRGLASKAAVTAVALGAFQVLAIVGAQVAQAATCTFNPSTNTINITIAPGEFAGVAVENAADDLDPESPPGAILFDNNGLGFDDGANSTQCGSASNTLTTSIVVLGSPSNNETFYIDNFDAGEFNTAITWAVDLGSNTVGGADLFQIFAADTTNDTVVLTDNSFTLNGGGGPLLGVEWDWVEGNEGDDTIDASAVTSAVTWLFGGDDDDWIAPGSQATIPFPLGIPDDLTGDAGSDTLSYGTRTTSVVIDASIGTSGHSANADCDVLDIGDEEDVFGTFETFVSGSADDCLVGDTGTNEVFVPGDGNDDITGNAADDDAVDWSSSSAAMTIDPANGSATGQGTDTFTDIFNFVGSAFDDTLLWDGSTDGFVGGDGVDLVDASAATTGQAINLDTLDDFGGVEVDTLENVTGGSGNDTLTGNDLRNVITAGAGDDTLNGAAGNDTLFGLEGNDTFNGGSGADTVSFAQSANGVTADVSLGFASGEGDDSLGFIEILIGSPHNDNLTGGELGGGSVNWRLTGGAGNDKLTGSDSNDLLRGGTGNDRLRGGNGDDTLIGGKGSKDKGWGGSGVDFCTGVEVEHGCEA